MARMRADGTVLLNDVQFATFEDLKTKAVDGIIHRDVIALYKANVIRGIAKYNVIKPFGTATKDGMRHYKLVPLINVILQPAPVSREESVEQPEQMAA